MLLDSGMSVRRAPPVGATLVVARVCAMYGVGMADTGDHKGRPYGGTIPPFGGARKLTP